MLINDFNNANELLRQDIPDEIYRIILSAKARNEIPEPILFIYSNVLDNNLDRKLANYISRELKRNIKVVVGEECCTIGDIAAKLKCTDEKDLVFIDDISAIYSRGFGDLINVAIINQYLPITIGKGIGARHINLPLPPLEWICSIPRDSKYIKSIRGKFGYVIDLNLYDDTVQFINHRVDRYRIPERQYLISRLTQKDIPCEIIPSVLIQCRDYYLIYHSLTIENIEHIVIEIIGGIDD